VKNVTLRLGFLENITHASALIGIKEGFFTKDLGPHVTLKLFPFSTGTEEATALLAGQLDAAYVGPNPAIKAWQTSGGKLISVISGSASGGAELVVKSSITSPAQLKGQKLATPSLGNTQDVSLRHWLKTQGLTSTSTGGGDVPITPITPNSDAVLAFQSGSIAGGWEPAPYDAEMVADGGKVLVNEASLWPQGQFVTTELVATQSFIQANPTAISGLLKGQIDANNFIAQNKTQAETDANAELASLSGKALKSSIVAASFAQITFTNDPIASSLITDATNAVGVGLLKPVSGLGGIYDLSPLNKLLTADGQPAVSS
jgi:NitT/TauT family transport system substrate-binding protein